MAVIGAALIAGLVAAPGARASFTSPSLVLSNNQSAATAVSYRLFFTPSSLLATLQASGLSLVVALPNGGAGQTVSGLSGATFSAALSTDGGSTFNTAAITSTTNTTNNLVAVNFASTVFNGLSAVPEFKITISGLTNPTVSSPPLTENVCLVSTLTAITGLLSGITNTASGGPTSGTLSTVAGLIDTACVTDSIVAVASNGVTTALSVAPLLNVSLDATSANFTITPTDTGTEASGTNANTVTVRTNALTYTIGASMAGSSSVLTNEADASKTIPMKYFVGAGSCPSDNSTGLSSFGTNGSATSVASSLTGLTNGAASVVNYCWNVDLTKPAGTYTSTITYVVTPSF